MSWRQVVHRSTLTAAGHESRWLGHSEQIKVVRRRRRRHGEYADEGEQRVQRMRFLKEALLHQEADARTRAVLRGPADGPGTKKGASGRSTSTPVVLLCARSRMTGLVKYTGPESRPREAPNWMTHRAVRTGGRVTRSERDSSRPCTVRWYAHYLVRQARAKPGR